MTGRFVSGISVGVGIGWLNATALGLPGRVTILMMGVLAVMGAIQEDFE